MASHLQVKETQTLPHSKYVETLYLLENYHGKGIGKQLLKEIFHCFHQKNYQTIIVEVLAIE
ncbi:N-acetyltransferase family protein [Lysinibacillus capsici]|uniref:GNAT family N-acetyltransferase n=1 Tax=Lysinibacillus capsici TaxID=2115968 RepID=UPI0021529893|nr:GNAT family N-acetyltransferase [Lysinibacillus capsici]MCR6522311.1 GNAT family N-acetyltransferase [Lysinibacillus capsici]MED4554793.1 GNAT family N-acetyltransferase [Lysinibacillus capsici]